MAWMGVSSSVRPGDVGAERDMGAAPRLGAWARTSLERLISWPCGPADVVAEGDVLPGSDTSVLVALDQPRLTPNEDTVRSYLSEALRVSGSGPRNSKFSPKSVCRGLAATSTLATRTSFSAGTGTTELSLTRCGHQTSWRHGSFQPYQATPHRYFDGFGAAGRAQLLE
jgi:hypothetical protein